MVFSSYRGKKVVRKETIYVVLMLVLGVMLYGCKGTITGAAIFDSGPSITVDEMLVDSGSANFTWSTSVSANSSFVSGAGSMDYDYATSFDIQLIELNVGTTYTYEITACDDEGNDTVCNTLEGNFTTEEQIEEDPSDEDAPVITISVETTADSATITWQTDEDANSTFYFDDTEASYSFGTIFDATVTELDPDIVYAYIIHFCDEAENCNTTEQEFTTDAAVDETAPSVDVTASATADSVTISWDTDEGANSTLTFDGEDTAYPSDTDFQKTVDNLDPETTYDYTIHACDASENCATETGDITTSAEDEFTITIDSIDTTKTTADLEWSTSEPATSRFHYSNVLYTFSMDSEFELGLEDLLENSTYIFNLSACNSESECTFILSNFSTEAGEENTDDVEVSADVYVAHNSIEVEWTTGISSNCTLVIEGDSYTYDTDTSFSDEYDGLAASTDHDIDIECCDGSDCDTYSTTVTTEAEPDSTGPGVTFGNIELGPDYAKITWTTGESAVSHVYFNSTKTDFSSATSFSHTIEGLGPGDYSFVISACDNNDNCDSLSKKFTIEGKAVEPEETASAPPPPPPPVAKTVEEAPAETAQEESAAETEAPKEVLSGSAVLEGLEFRPKKKLGNILIWALLIFILAGVAVVNVSYVRTSMKVKDNYNVAVRMIRKAGALIKAEKVEEAYHIYPKIMKAYKNIDDYNKMKKLEGIMKVLYTQLQLHYVVKSAENLTDEYLASGKGSLKTISAYLDSVPELLEDMKKLVPSKNHASVEKYFMARHHECMNRIVERK